MPCSRTVPVSGPSATRRTAARVALFKRCADVWGRNVILKTIGTVYRSFAIDGALFPNPGYA